MPVVLMSCNEIGVEYAKNEIDMRLKHDCGTVTCLFVKKMNAFHYHYTLRESGVDLGHNKPLPYTLYNVMLEWKI